MRLRLMLPAAVLTVVCGSPVFAAPVVVSCAPGQRAVVRDTFVQGESVTRVECVRAQTETPRASRIRYVTRYADDRPRRSWGKSALIIGGSAGSGAGIGGLVRGRKGALIGAALGGGAASIYEGARRR